MDVLTAMDWYRKGYAFRFHEYNLKEAMNAFDKSIALDSNFSMAYAGRAAIYWRSGRCRNSAVRRANRPLNLTQIIHLI